MTLFGRVLAISLICASAAFPQERSKPAEIDYETAHLLRIATAVRLNGKITIDGRLDEPAWELATPAGNFLDWHPAPRRQWVIILSGELEIGLGDGSVRRFGPGDARLVEDTTGHGHTTRVIGSQPCVMAFVPLEGSDRSR